MAEIKFGSRMIDLPYMIQLYGVSPQKFDALLDEDMNAELIRGVMYVYSASYQGENIAEFLRCLMRGYAAKTGLGSVLRPDRHLYLGRGLRVCPDLFFLSKERTPNPLPKEYEGYPDLILEVFSIPKSEVQWRVKLPLYQRAGIKEIWFVAPGGEDITIHRLRGSYYVTVTKTSGRLESKVIEGFWIELEWLRSDPLPDVSKCLRDILG